jgi:hypothetical protein
MTPVADDRQAEALKRVKRGVPRRVGADFAKRFTGVPALTLHRYYYLARAGFMGTQSDPPTFPEYVRFGVDISDEGVAYIASFKMSSSPAESEAAVIISSNLPLKRFVSLCGSVH